MKQHFRNMRCRRRHACGAGLAAAGIAAAVPHAVLAQTDANPSRLEEIIVTSNLTPVPRRQVATAVSVLDGADLELRGYHALADALRTQPGIGVSNTGGPGKSTALRIRGEEGFRTLLIIDGVKAVDASAPQVGPSFDSLLTTGDLARVEVLRGPQGFMYGADAGGVVNVLTRSGEGAASVRLGAELGDFGTRKLEASAAGGGERGDFYLSVADLATDGFNARASDTVLRDDDGADNTTLHAKLGLNATENLRLQLVVRDIDAEAMYDNCFLPVTFDPTDDCLGTTDQTTYKLSADYRSGKLTHAFGYSNVDIARDNLSNGQSAFATEGELGRFEYTGSFAATESATLAYGLDLQTEKIGGDEPRERDQDAFYVEYQGQLGDAFYYSAGARYDDNADFGSHTSTRLSGAYVQELGRGSTLKYRASIGTGFRPPSLFEIAYNRGPNSFPPAAGTLLTEESSRGYDLGIELDATSGLHFEATYFDHEIEDEIAFDLVGFSGYLQSSGTSTSTGVELAVEAPIGQRLTFLGNWTNNDAETADDAPRRRRPKNLGNLGLLYQSMDQKLRFALNYRLSMDAVDIGDQPLDDYEVLDLSATYAINDTLEIHGRIENVTDERYVEVIGFNSAERAAYAGIRLRF